MKNNYLNFIEGEITVYCGENARANVHASLRQGKAIAASPKRGNIMYINTVFSTRSILSAARQELAKPKNDTEGIGSVEAILFHHVLIGELSQNMAEIQATIEGKEIKYLIINSWEFANRSYGFKERSLFALINFASELGVSVIIYSHVNMEGACAGQLHRGGLGKLAVIAKAIIWSNSDAILEELAEKTRILSDRKINELEYAHSKSGISEGGELISSKEKEVFEEELVEELMEA